MSASRQHGSITRRRGAAAIVLITLTLVIAGCGKSPEQSIAAARASMADNDYPAAVIDLKNALQETPDNREARTLLAEVAFALGDYQSAEKELERAYELGVDAAAYRALHYRIQLALAHFEEVGVSLAQPGGADGLSAAEADTFRGEASLGLRKLDEAETSFRRAIGADPAYGPAKVGLAAALQARGDFDGAQRLLDDVVASHPEIAGGWLMRGQMAMRSGRLEAARDDLEKAVQTARQTPDRVREFVALGSLAEAQLGLADLTGAEKSVAALRRSTPNSPLTRKISAKLHFAKQEFSEARADLQKVLRNNDGDLGALFLLGAVYLAEGDPAQAEIYLNQVVTQAPGNLAARKLLAEAQLRQSRPDSAVEALAPLLESEGGLDLRTSYLASQALLRSGETAEAIELLEEGHAADPDNLQVAMSLGAAYLSARRIDDAVALFESLPESDDYRRDLLLALAYAARNETEQAQARIDRIVAENPEDNSALLLVAEYYFAANELDASRRYLEQIVAAEPGHVRARLNLARIAFREGEPEAAQALLEGVLEDEPENVAALLVLGEVAAREGRLDDAESLLEQALAVQPDVAAGGALLARVRLAKRDLAGAEEAAQAAYQSAPDSPAALLAVGEVSLVAGRFREASGYFAELIEKQPEMSTAWYQQARAQLALDDKLAARESLDQALELQPDLLGAAALGALLDSSEGKTEEALATAARLQEAYPELAAPQVLEGEIRFRAEQYPAAAMAFERGYAKQASAGIAIRAHQARVRAGGDGVELLESWLSEHPDDGRVRLLIAEYRQRSGDNTSAIDEYERIVEADAGNAVALNNLAWLLHEQGDERAEGLARQAFELRPDLPQIQDTLGWILVNTGKVAEGLELLEKANQAAPKDGDIAYHLAVALDKSGERDRSGALLRELLAENRAFASRADAERLLAEIGGQ